LLKNAGRAKWEAKDLSMGLELTVTFPVAVPAWSDVQELLAKHGPPIQMRMIDGQLAFPDEMPTESWQEVRASSDAGMVTLRHDQNRVTLVTWGNAEASLLRLRNALAWAFAEAGNGRIQTDEGEWNAADLLLNANVPVELRG
jgi:hypothetical protein